MTDNKNIAAKMIFKIFIFKKLSQKYFIVKAYCDDRGTSLQIKNSFGGRLENSTNFPVLGWIKPIDCA